MAANEKIKQVRVRERLARSTVGVGQLERSTITLRDPAHSTVISPRYEIVYSSVDFVEFTGPWWRHGPPSTPWTSTLINRIQMELIDWGGTGQNSWHRISELYLDVETNAKPVVSAVTVTGTTNSTTPYYSFTYADTENDPQVWAQARVFRDDVYGAAGFSADTSKVTWDSGIVATSALDGTVTRDLVNGETYKVYVRAAQSLNGQQFWSDWAASSAFLIQTIPPVAPTLQVTPDSTLPNYRVRLAVTANMNMLTSDEASLETSTTGWAALTNCTISQSAAVALDGTKSLQLSSTAAGLMSAITLTGTAGLPVDAGITYTAVASFRTAVTAQSVNIKIRWYNRAGGTISTVAGSNVTDATGSWVQPFVTAVAPALSAFAAVIVEVVTTAGIAELHRVDEIGMWTGTSVTWAPGGNQPTGIVVCERSELVANYDGPTLNWAHPQLASGTATTKDTSGFTSRNATDFLASDVMDLSYPGSAAGQRMLNWYIVTGTGSFLDIGGPNTAIAVSDPPYLLAAPPGRQMVFSLWAKVNGGTAGLMFLNLQPVDQFNNAVGSFASTGPFTITTAWQRFSVAMTLPAGCVWARASLNNTGPVTEIEVHVTGVQWEPGTTPGPTAPGQGISPVWTSVRGCTALSANADDQVANGYDEEPVGGRPILYRARTVANLAGGSVGSPIQSSSIPSTVAMTVLDPPSDPLLKDPLDPTANLLVSLQPVPLQIGEDTGEVHALGRDGDTIITSDWLGGDDGTLTIEPTTTLDYYKLRLLLRARRSLYLALPAGGCRYVRLIDRQLAPQSPFSQFYTVTLPYRATARPPVTS